MQTIALQARRPLLYQGQSIESGQVFFATAKEALALVYRRDAVFAPTIRKTPPPMPLVPAEAITPKRRRYRRRDLVADE